MDESTQAKPCTKCGESKPLSEFHRRSGVSSGRVSHCKSCQKATGASRYAATVTDEVRERGRATAKARRANMSPEELDELRARNRAYMARRYAAHRAEVLAKQNAARAADPERFREYAQKFRDANPEKLREWNRASRLANPQQRTEAHHRRRARRLGTSVGPIDLEALWTGSCGICEQPLDRTLAHPDPMSKSIDHITALAQGGTHTQDNLQWAHLMCNVRKGAR